MELKSHQVKASIDRWRKILNIESQWKINFLIRNKSNEMSEGNEGAMACIIVSLSYFSAVIEFNAAEIQEDDFESVVLHELLHIIIEPLAISSGCGLGEKFEEMNIILCESTIERLMPGYMYLFNQVYGIKGKKKQLKTSKKLSSRAIRCRKA